MQMQAGMNLGIHLAIYKAVTSQYGKFVAIDCYE